MAAGSGETQAQVGRRGIGFRRDSSWESSVGDGGGTHLWGQRWGSYLRVFVWGHGVRMSRTIGHTHITRPLVPILLYFIVLSWGMSMWNKKWMWGSWVEGRKGKWKGKVKDHKKLCDDIWPQLSSHLMKMEVMNRGLQSTSWIATSKKWNWMLWCRRPLIGQGSRQIKHPFWQCVVKW